jgi:hypothetical protein
MNDTGASGMWHALDSRPVRILLTIANAALLIRLLPLLHPGDHWAVLDDSHEYLALAKGMLSGCGFARLDDGSCRPPELLRLPGYPLFLALMPGLRSTIAVQALLGAATCLLIGLFTYTKWGFTAGVISETLLALDIPSVVASSSIMSDCLFETLLTLAMVLQLWVLSRRLADRRGTWLALLAAFPLAYAVLLRPVAVVLPPLAALPFLLLPRLSIKRRLGLSLLAVAIPVSVMGCWTLRNHLRTGRWTFTTDGAYNLYYYNTAGVLWFMHDGSLTELQEELGRSVGATGPDEFVSARQEHEMTKRSLAVFFGHPVATSAMTLRCLAWLAIVPDRANLNAVLGTNARSSVFLMASQNVTLRIREMLRSPLLSVFVAVQVPLTIFMWIGVGITLKQIRRQPRGQLPLILIALGVAFVMLLIGAGPQAIARFRLPAVPFLAILAGVGWSGTFGPLGKNHLPVLSIE